MLAALLTCPSSTWSKAGSSNGKVSLCSGLPSGLLWRQKKDNFQFSVCSQIRAEVEANKQSWVLCYVICSFPASAFRDANLGKALIAQTGALPTLTATAGVSRMQWTAGWAEPGPEGTPHPRGAHFHRFQALNLLKLIAE